MNSKEANFHDDFIREILLQESDKEKLLKKAKNLNWDVRNKYVCISFKEINNRVHLEDHRNLIGAIRTAFSKEGNTDRSIGWRYYHPSSC